MVQNIFGERIRELRLKEHLTQGQLGERVGLTYKGVSSIENGERGTTLDKLVALAQYFHVSTDYLLGITDDPTWRGE